MRISAKADYAVRALVELAAGGDEPVKRDQIAEAQEIPVKFLQNILAELRHADLVRSQRGPDGGHRLARPAGEITIADAIRAVDGPLAMVQEHRPEETAYSGRSECLQQVWLALRANMRRVLERVTIADVADSRLPRPIVKLAESPDAL
jgi:Rrf2 family protein